MPIIGYTTRRHLLLDLDNTTQTKAEIIARLIMRQYPKVGDCLIVLSSHGEDTLRWIYTRWQRPLLLPHGNSFHLIFDNSIGYNTSCKIIQVLSGLQVLNKDYEAIRQFRGDMTLRVSPAILSDHVKPAPEIVAYIRNTTTQRHDHLIVAYLKIWRLARLFFKERKQKRDALDGTGNSVTTQLDRIRENATIELRA